MHILGFVYRRVMDFPEDTEFETDCLTSTTFYKDVYRFFCGKIHQHHSHVTGKYKALHMPFVIGEFGYEIQIHMFCTQFFNFYFVVKSICLSVYGT